MTRNDEMRKGVGRRGKRGSLRRIDRTRRVRSVVISVALGFASLPFLPCELGTPRAFAASTITSSSLQAAQAAASKSLYAQRQQQARIEAQRQAAAQEQARIQAENQARAQRQAQAAQAAQAARAAQAQAQAQAENSKKSFLSDLFKREPIDPNSNPGTFNSFERAQFASRGGTGTVLPNEPKPERVGLGLSLFKKRDASEQASPQALPSNQTTNRAPYVQTETAGSQAIAARGTAPSSAVLAKASSSQTDARDALAKVPWDLMPQQTRERLSQLASSPTLYRRLPMSGGACNPELFDFFLTYPHTIVELWRSSGYDGLTMTPEGKGAYAISEKGGSSGRIQIIYQDSELTLVHCYGSYVSPAFPRPLEGEAFIILQTRYTEDGSKTPLVVCRMDTFIGIKNVGADLLARTFNSFVGKIADSNFESTLGFICGVSRSIEESPQEFQQVVASLRLDPNAKNILISKTQEAANQARARRLGQTVEYRLLAKANAPQPGYARILSRGDSAPSLPNGQGVLAEPSGFARSSSSYGKTVELNMSKTPSFSSNEFALAPDGDFEDSLDWGDERMATGEETLAARRFDSSNSIAKIGAKTSTNSSVVDLLEEQEENDRSNYQYDEFVSTDVMKANDEALLADEESDAADLTNDALLVDDSDDETLTTDDSGTSDELTMTLDFGDAGEELKNSPVAIPYAAQTGSEKEAEDGSENELIATETLDESSEVKDSTQDEELLTTLELPDDLDDALASEDAPVVPLAATTNNPSSSRAKALNSMKRAPKKAKEPEPVAAKSLAEASPEEALNEEKIASISEAISENANETKPLEPTQKVDKTSEDATVAKLTNEDVDFESVAQEIETRWTPILNETNDGEFSQATDGFRAVSDANVKSETPSKTDEPTPPVFTALGLRRNTTTESEKETGTGKRFITRRFTPRGNSGNGKPIPSFRSVLNGDEESDEDDEKSKVKPLDRLRNAVVPNASN